jgi:hypothetical protein
MNMSALEALDLAGKAQWLQSACMQFENLPLQQGTGVRTHAVWEPTTAAG